MASCGQDPEDPAIPLPPLGVLLVTGVAAFGRLPFFLVGPMLTPAFNNLSDSVAGTVDGLAGFGGGLTLSLLRNWIEASVSLVIWSERSDAS